MNDPKTCTHCSTPTDGDGWPDGEGGALCQECWERECSAEWWRTVTAEAGQFSKPGACHWSPTGWAWQDAAGQCSCAPCEPLAEGEVGR